MIEREVCPVCGKSDKIDNKAYGKKNLIWWRSCGNCGAVWDIRKLCEVDLTNVKL